MFGKRKIKKEKIKKGWAVYCERFPVAGVGFHLNNVKKAFRWWSHPNVNLKREPKNKYDKKAVQVICSKTISFLPFKRKYLIGYIPAAIAKIIVDLSLIKVVVPRLHVLYKYKGGNRLIIMDLIGPKDKLTDKIKKSLNKAAAMENQK